MDTASFNMAITRSSVLASGTTENDSPAGTHTESAGPKVAPSPPMLNAHLPSRTKKKSRSEECTRCSPENDLDSAVVGEPAVVGAAGRTRLADANPPVASSKPKLEH